MTDVVMPQMGESITEGTLTKWLKKKGDKVEQDELLFEISTDKVDTEVPAPAAGTLVELLVEEGATVAINTVVARIEETGGATASAEPEATAAPEPVPEPEKPAPKPSTKAAPPPEPPPAPPQPASPQPASPQPAPARELQGPVSPLVRRMARENNLDLSRIKGTGAGGRITKSDVEEFIARGPAAPETVERLPRAEPAKARVEPMGNMRQKIAEHMIYSKQTSAHVTTVHRADMTKVAKLRASLKASFKERYGFSLTYLPFITRATAQALREFPIVNASIEGTNILYHNEINIGIAVALDNGLIVPVIRNADSLSVVGLQRAIVDLAQRARSRQLKPDEVHGATFSITNFGSFGSLFATPVINQPNVAILGIGAVTKEPVVTPDDAIAIRSTAYVSLTFDHRLIDGALADQFTAKVKDVLENWSERVL